LQVVAVVVHRLALVAVVAVCVLLLDYLWR
jgi:hypothetical protein